MRRRGFWLIVTGTGRCGTRFMTQTLSSVGVKCTHEGIFQPNKTAVGPDIPPGLVTDEEILARIRQRRDNVWWGWQAESSWMAAPYLDRPGMQDLTVVHLVRDPKKTIDSMVRTGGFRPDIGALWWEFQVKFLPELAEIDAPYPHTGQMDTDGRVARAGLFYVRWNQMIEPHADIRWRVEDPVTDLLDMLEIDYTGKEVFNDTTCGTAPGYRPVDIDLSRVPEPTRTELFDMVRKYGYD